MVLKDKMILASALSMALALNSHQRARLLGGVRSSDPLRVDRVLLREDLSCAQVDREVERELIACGHLLRRRVHESHERLPITRPVLARCAAGFGHEVPSVVEDKACPQGEAGEGASCFGRQL